MFGSVEKRGKREKNLGDLWAFQTPLQYSLLVIEYSKGDKETGRNQGLASRADAVHTP